MTIIGDVKCSFNMCLGILIESKLSTMEYKSNFSHELIKVEIRDDYTSVCDSIETHVLWQNSFLHSHCLIV